MYDVRVKTTNSGQFLGRTVIVDCLHKVGEKVELFGWVETVRSHGKIAFLDLHDRSATIQVAGFTEGVVKSIASLRQQDVVCVKGIVKKREERYINQSSKAGSIEIHASEVIVIANAAEMPFDMGGKDLHLELPTLLDYRSLSLRHHRISPIFLVQAAIAKSFREIAEQLGCVEIFIPTIVASATEGGAQVFQIDYYDNKAYLAQSPQLYKQMMVPVFERVFTIAHAYRAEPSVTTRHLSESTQMDCEFGFVTFETLLDLLEEVGTYIVTNTAKLCEDIVKQFGLEPVSVGSIPRLSLREAQEIIFKEYGRDVRNEDDLAPNDEVDICAWALKNHKSDFVTITHFPTHKKPFYTMPDPKDPTFSLSYDLLFRGVEILSGSQRVNDYQSLMSAIKERGMNPKAFGLYLQAFQYGMPQEGGFSFGLERLTMKIMGVQNIREASLFPRDMERVDERFSKANKEE